jgi:tetratricopeptide (TPR) repeat protein
MAFKKLAAYYQTHRKLESAEIAVSQAEEETMAALKAQAVESAVLLDALGSAIKDIGTERALKQAEKLFKSSLALREHTLSSEHAAVASSLENLGRLFLAQGRTAQAEPLLKRSYEISLSTLGPDRRETQLRLDSLAQSFAAGGHYSEAEALYKRVLDTTGKGKANQTAIADIACNLAAMLVKQGRYSEALPYYARALKIQEGANGPQHASLASLLDSYAYALGKANRGAEAKKYQARARSIRG